MNWVGSLASGVSIAFGQPSVQPAQDPAPAIASPARPRPYLDSSDISFLAVLAPPPDPASSVAAADREIVTALQAVDDARYASAELDSQSFYPRFEAAFGHPIDRDASPALIRLLDRAVADTNAVVFPAKRHFSRLRPFQQMQLRHVCGMDQTPVPTPDARGGSSYPSGHAAWGWTAAMILAEVEPARAQALMARAADYGESRVVCGVHFPSDVAAGQLVSAAVVGRLHGNPEFQADLTEARREAGVR